MNQRDYLLNVSSSPHVRNSLTTRKVMYQVVLALMPVTILGVVNYGIGALTVVLAAVISAVLTEAAFCWICKKPNTATDGSAVVTGLLLALCLPPGIPMFIPCLGSVFAILFVKCFFGGLGYNFMNPALVARCFLLISFSGLITNYRVDGIATATPLANLAAGKEVDLLPVLVGSASGVIGSSALGLLLGALILFIVKGITWEIPTATIGSFVAFMAIFSDNGLDLSYQLMHLCGGGMLMGTFFMATDPVTSPVTSRGQIMYGICIGLLSGLFRVYGSSADSVSYAIIIANMLVPFIDNFSMQKPYGHREKKKFSVPKPAMVLCVITLFAGVALSGVYEMTKDAIEAQKVAAQAAAYREVCPQAENFATDPYYDDVIDDMDGEVYGTAFGKSYIDQVVLGTDTAGNLTGYVVSVTSGDGFDGNIKMSVGFDMEGTVLGIAFTEINETAGMGMLCAEPEFKDQFNGVLTDAFILNKAGGSVADNEIDSVSGASVSSEAIVNAVNAAIDFYHAYLI